MSKRLGSALLSLFLCTAAAAQSAQVPLTVSDGSSSATLNFGIDPSGSDGLDSGLDLAAPPAPPAGAFDARFTLGTEAFLTDIRLDNGNRPTGEIIYDLSFDGPDFAAIVLSWDASALAALGSFSMTDAVTGTLFGPLDMTQTGSLAMSDASAALLATLKKVRITANFNPGTTPPVNNTPVAIGDAASTAHDTAVTLNVISNDTDADNDALSVTAITQGSTGSVVDNNDGTVTYTPNTGSSGQDTFTYTVSDGTDTDQGTVTITVAGAVNTAPVAVDDAASTAHDTAVTLNVLTNDTDADSDALSVSAVTQASTGSVVNNNDGTLTYTPNTGSSGQDTFTYTVSDGTDTDQGTVTITVAEAVTPGNTLSVPLTVSDGASSATLSFGIDPSGSDGLDSGLDLAAPPSPPAGAFDARFTLGTEAFLTDIRLDNGNRPTGAVIYDLSFDGPDFAAIVLSWDASALAALGSFFMTDAVTGVLFGPVDMTQVGSLAMSDPSAAIITSLKKVRITANFNPGVGPANTAPVAVDDAASTDHDTAVTLNVLTNDTDADNDALSVTAITQGSTGSVVDNNDGTVTYTPTSGSTGDDTFTYTVSDGTDTDEGTVTITVAGAVNSAPVAVDDAASTAHDTAVTLNVLTNDTDADSDALSVSAVTQGSTGSVVNNNDGTVTYTPNTGSSGQDTFTYTVSDGTATDQGTVTITVAGAVTPGNTLSVPLTVSDGASSATLSFGIDPSGSDGLDSGLDLAAPPSPPAGAFDARFTLGTEAFLTDIRLDNGNRPTGAVIYDLSFDGPDFAAIVLSWDASALAALGSFFMTDAVTGVLFGPVDMTQVGSLAMSDPSAAIITSLKKVRITANFNPGVGPANTAPVAVDDAASTDHDTAVTLNVLTNDTDADNDALSVTAITQGSTGSVVDNNDGTVTYTPTSGSTGDDTFTYTVSDGTDTDEGTVTITVAGAVNSAPVAVDDAASTAHDTAVTLNVLTNDTDADSDALSVSAVTQGSTGSVVNNNDGTVTYTPNTGSSGQDTFTYTVSDGTATDQGTVTITVAGAVTPGNTLSVPLTVSDGSSSATLNFGIDPSGSDGLDSGLDLAAPPSPPAGAFDARFTLGTEAFLTDIRLDNGNRPTGAVIYDLSFDGPDFAAIVLSWDASALAALGSFFMTDAVTGVLFGPVDMTQVGSLAMSDPSAAIITSLKKVRITANFNPGVSPPANNAPGAVDDAASTAHDTAVTLNVLTNDTDADSDALSVTAVTQGSTGSVVNNNDGTVTYTPNTGFSGQDAFTYTVSDGTDTEQGTVTITVAGAANSPPVAVDDAAATAHDTAVTLNVLTNDTDADSDALSVSAVKQGSTGSVVNNNDGTLTYTPNTGSSGDDTFTYTVSDGTDTDQGTVTITVAEAAGQCPFTVTTTPSFGRLIGGVTLDGATLAPEDCLAAIDQTGSVAAVAAPVLNSGQSYLDLTIYGDDNTTSEVDEGISDGESFSLWLYDASTNTRIPYDDGRLFEGWVSTNGTPLPGFEQSFVYDFLIAPTTVHNLATGWNLIGLSAAPTASATSDVFAGIASELTFVTGFVCGSGAGAGAKFYDPNGLSFLNTLLEVEAGMGVWVKVEADVTLAIPGTLPAEDFSVDMCEGWNLQAYWGIGDYRLSRAFSDPLGNDQIIFVTDFLGGQGSRFFDPAGLSFLNTLSDLRRHAGYWVKNTTDLPGFQFAQPSGPATVLSRSTTSLQPDHMGDFAITNVFDFVRGTATLSDGRPLPNGSLVQAVTESGVIVGSLSMLDGYLVPAAIYGDDVTTGVRDGASARELVHFVFQGQMAEQSVPFSGDLSVSDVALTFPMATDAEPSEVPTEFRIESVYPNPFNPSAEVLFTLPRSGETSVDLFDAQGKLVRHLLSETLPAGRHRLSMNGSGLPSGIYFLVARSGANRVSSPVVLLR